MEVTREKMQDWMDAKEALSEAKSKELELRLEICEGILKEKRKGTVHFKRFGLDAAAVAKVNTKVDEKELKEIFPKLSEEEKACIRYKYELVSKEYSKLPDDSIFHQAITTKPGMPGLTIKELGE